MPAIAGIGGRIAPEWAPGFDWNQWADWIGISARDGLESLGGLLRNMHAGPKEIYRFFTDAKLHAKVTEKAARISKKVGGAFETCDGNNVGYNLALDPGKRIVQAWSHQDFPDDAYTVVDIKLKSKKGGTEIEFNQTGVPTSCHSWLDSGWHYAYWDQLNKFYPKKGK